MNGNTNNPLTQAPRQALILNGNNPLERAVLHNLREQKPALHIIDLYTLQLREWIKLQNPQVNLSPEDLETKTRKHVGSANPDQLGCWIYYPWRHALVHCLEAEEFIRVRTVRNRYKITDDEQELLRKCKVGIIGLSVGQSVAMTIASERIAGTLRIADFDTLELSNMNRIRTGLLNQGELKTTIVARDIAEMDPFIDVSCYDGGVLPENIRDFVNGLDVVVDECDNPEIKILLRKVCRELRIPVVMDTSDLLMIDVERFDLEHERPIFHGLVDETTSFDASSHESRAAIVQAILEPHKASERGISSLQQIGKTITSWPQLATDVAMGGAFAAKVVREILLGNPMPSGRMRINLIEHFIQQAEYKKSIAQKHV